VWVCVYVFVLTVGQFGTSLGVSKQQVALCCLCVFVYVFVLCVCLCVCVSPLFGCGLWELNDCFFNYHSYIS
jgi:hypothetical protein